MDTSFWLAVNNNNQNSKNHKHEYKKLSIALKTMKYCTILHPSDLYCLTIAKIRKKE